MMHPTMKVTASVFSFLHRKGRGLFALAVALFMLQPLTAEADRNFALRYSSNANGDMVLVGNMLLHCADTSGAFGTNCTAARTGSSATASNRFLTMQRVDADSDGTTSMSSGATLTIPPGSTVLFAGLYWHGWAAGAATARNTAKFKTPAMAGYSTVTASQVDDNGTSTTSRTYQSFANVTSQVVAGGSGTYWVADTAALYCTTLVTGTYGNNTCSTSTAPTSGYEAGWSLVVVFSNDAYPFRNFSVFDGFLYIQSGDLNITVNGFLTPYNGPVITRLGAVVYDGDVDGVGDRLRVNTTYMTDALRTDTNVFQGLISDLGVRQSGRFPSYNNALGYDLARFNVPAGTVPNAATSAALTVVAPTGGSPDYLWPGILTFATDIYVPVVVPNVVKTAQDMSPSTPLLRGDTLRWNVVMSNTGLDSATNLIAIDNIPAYLTYKPGSLVISSGANAGAKSDGDSDDQAEFLTGPDRVVFRLGTGASATLGGTLAYNQSTSFYFDTIVNADAPPGVNLTNQVQIQYNSQTLPATTFAASSAAATATVMGPPTITKAFSPSIIDVGQNTLMTITVANPAANPLSLTGVTFSDAYPSGLINAVTPNPQVNCTPGSTAGTITGGTSGGNSIGMNPGATIAPNGSCIITVNVTSNAINNYLNTTSVVSSTNGGSGATAASAVLYVGKPRITKAFAPASINANGTSTITFTLQNLAASPLTQVAFSDSLVNMRVASTPTVVGNCGGGVVTAAPNSNSISLAGGNLAASGSCTISVNVTSNIAGVHPNTTTGVASNESGPAGQPSNTAELTVIGPPLVSKSFFPVSVRTATPAGMTITITNPNPGTALSSVSLADSYPSGLVNSTPSNATLTCSAGSSGTLTGGVNGGNSVGVSGGVLAAGGNCVITVDVQAAAENTYPNVTGAVGSNVGSGTTATASLVVANRLSATKSFSPTSIAFNNPPSALTSSVMTITVTASAGVQVNGLNFQDDFPTGLMVAATPAASTTCSSASLQGRTGTGAWGAVAAGNTALRITGGNLNGGANCAVTVSVTSGSTAAYANTTGTIYSTNGGTGLPATGTLNVLGPVQISKSFTSDTIASSGTSLMTISLSNPTTATVNLTGVGVDDLFPSTPGNMTISGTTSTRTCTSPAATPAASTFVARNNANNGWDTSIVNGRRGVRITGLTLQPGQTCNFSTNVTTSAVGIYTNNTDAVTSTNGGTGGSASALLYVAQPTVAKSFNCTQPIVAGSSCTMYISMTAPAGSALTSAQLIDIFPYESASGGFFTLASTTIPALTLTAGSGTCPTFTAQGRTGSSAAWSTPAIGNTALRITTAAAGIPSGATCRLTATVTSTQTATNTIRAGDLTGTIGGSPASNADDAFAVLNVHVTPQVEKSFAVPSILVNASTSMTIELTNLNGIAASNVAFTDSFPGETATGGTLRLANATVSNSCGGTPNGRTGSSGAWGPPAMGNTALRLQGGSIGIGSVCAVTANVTSATAGVFENSTGTVTTTNIGNADEDRATLVVMAPPTLAKAFTPNAMLVNESSVLTITLSNPNSIAITGAALTDTYPSGLVNTTTPNASTSCAGSTLTAVAGGNSVAISGATIPANGSCTINVQVTSATAAVYTNNTGSVTTANAGTGTTVSAVLTVTPQLPSLSLTKLVSVISDPVNGTSNPKFIPGAVSAYTLRITNAGLGTVDNGTVLIRDTLPTQVELYVGTGSTPPAATDLLQGFGFTDGTPSSGLTCTFTARNDGGDCIDFSSDGTTFSYIPSPGADGFDAAIKAIQFRPQGVFNSSSGTNPSAEFQFRVRVR